MNRVPKCDDMIKRRRRMSVSKKRWLVMLSAVFALLAVITVVILSENKLYSWVKGAPVIKESSTEKSKEEIEKILVQWVYNNSKNISMAGCQEISSEAMKVNKPLLILSIMDVESNFNPGAISNKGAIGLTQVMFDIHKESLIKSGIIKEKRDLFNIGPSIRAGSFIMDSCLIQSKADVSKALELYLGGQDVFYVKRILSNLGNLYILTR